MASRATRLVAIATAALLTGCGGSSGKSTTGPTAGSTGASSGQTVTAKNGGFSTIVPKGYTYTPTAAQYVVSGAEAGGLQEQIAVLRTPTSEGDLATVAREQVRALKRPPKPAQEVSALRPLIVAGEPAVAVDYVVSLGVGQAQLNKIVLVGHGRWVYSIRASSSPEQSATLNRAVEEVIRSWHWLK